MSNIRVNHHFFFCSTVFGINKQSKKVSSITARVQAKLISQDYTYIRYEEGDSIPVTFMHRMSLDVSPHQLSVLHLLAITHDTENKIQKHVGVMKQLSWKRTNNTFINYVFNW